MEFFEKLLADFEANEINSAVLIYMSAVVQALHDYAPKVARDAALQNLRALIRDEERQHKGASPVVQILKRLERAVEEGELWPPP